MEKKKISGLAFNYAVKVECFEAINGGIKLTLLDDKSHFFNLEITAFEEAVLRLNLYSQSVDLPEYDFINHEVRKSGVKAEISETEDAIILRTSKLTAKIDKNPYCLTVLNQKGKVVLQEQLHDVNAVGEGEDRVPPLGFSSDDEDKYLSANICFKLGVYEKILGLGERFTEFDKRGQTVIMRNADALGVRTEKAYKNIPFYLSTAGYGLFVNSHLQTEFFVGTRSAESLNIHVPGNQAEFFIFTGTKKEIVSAFTRLTGPAYLPPKWSFGNWYSNCFKASSKKDMEADAKRMRALNLPCDVIHLDCYWLRDDHWCDFVWDEAQYPDYKDFLADLKSNHYRICCWINPYVTVKTEMYLEGAALGYFVKNQKGEPYLADLWHGLLSLCAMVDFTNPEAKKWYQDKVEALYNDGVDVVKTDFGEEIPEDGVFYNGKSGKEMRNIYANLYNFAVMAVAERVKGADAMVWGRSGFAGMQKFPVCWSGDPHSSYSGMASVLKSGLSIGISGVPFWSHDIGGFFGLEDEEIFVRWAQFGLLSSHSRFHGTTTRQPWAYGERATKIVSEFMRLRYKLMPYILKTAESCANEGLPFLRAMSLHCEDDSADGIWDQYMIGDDVLVAPVFGPDNTIRRVYLPEGEWTNYFTGDIIKGNGYITICSPLETIPLFIRAGVDLEMDESGKQFID